MDNQINAVKKEKLSFFDRWFSSPIYNGDIESPGDDILMKANAILIDTSKSIITLSIVIVGISISMKKEMENINQNFLIYSWVAEGVSLVSGLLFLYSMVRLYINWNKANLVDKTSTVLGVIQFFFFIAGLVLMAMASLKGV